MMRIPILAAIVLMIFIPSASYSQLVPPERVEPVGSPLFVVTVKGQTGFMDPGGQLVIKPAFERALPFHDGLAAVQRQGQWGFIDTTGRMVIEPQFISVGSFSEGLAKFQVKRYPDKLGYIDKTGQVVIQPQFDVAEDFRNGVARVGVATYKGILLSLIADVGVECHYKFIDRNGNRVPEPPPEHYATGEQDELIPFRKQGLYGYVNAEGQVVIEPQFEYAAAFSEGLARAYKNRLCGYIDKRGEWAIPPRFEYANDFSEGLAGVNLGEEGWGFIDRSGQAVVPGRYGWIYDGFRHGVAEVALDRKQAYINKKGEWIRPLGE